LEVEKEKVDRYKVFASEDALTIQELMNNHEKSGYRFYEAHVCDSGLIWVFMEKREVYRRSRHRRNPGFEEESEGESTIN
jgi:hypothetical protein